MPQPDSKKDVAQIVSVPEQLSSRNSSNSVDDIDVNLHSTDSSAKSPHVKFESPPVEHRKATRSYHENEYQTDHAGHSDRESGVPHQRHPFDRLIPTSDLFTHEVDLFQGIANSHQGIQHRVSYTAARTQSLHAPDHDYDYSTPQIADVNDPDLKGVEITIVDNQPQNRPGRAGSHHSQGSVSSDRNSNTGSSRHSDLLETDSMRSAGIYHDTQNKSPFLPRHMLHPPSSLEIVQKEFEAGELDADLVELRAKAAKKSGVATAQPTAQHTLDGSSAPREEAGVDVELGDMDKRSQASGPTSPERDVSDTESATPAFGKLRRDSLNQIETGSSSSQVGSTSSKVGSSSWLDTYRDMLRSGHKLDQWRATAICANDAISSVLYMTGSVITLAGVFAPLCSLLIAVLLYFFKNVYAVVTALPSNGGAYNILLNSTRKSIASMAAILTILSYIATAVVSGTEAVHYVHDIWEFDKKFLIVGVLGVLFIFAVLNFIGIGESSNVALAIFFFHVTTLLVLVGFSIVKLITNGDDRWSKLNTNWDYQSTLQPNFGKAIFFGFAAAALGCSGFESSSNFISEQRPGVFLKTIRNMHILCSFFNVLLPLCCIFHISFPDAIATNQINTSLSTLAFNLGGKPLQIIVCIDAACVLCGGVLTSYVGVTGLVTRLALDRVIPDWFLMKNKFRNTYHLTIFGFFLLCTSMYVILNGDSTSLSSTYSIAFLIVMTLFAVGVMLIKINRSTVTTERPIYWYCAIIGIIGCALALAGIIANDAKIIIPFLIYFSISVVLIEIMLCRHLLLGALGFILHNACCFRIFKEDGAIGARIVRYRDKILDTPMAFLTRCGDPSVINKAILYIKQNEDCCWVRIIHFYEDENDVPMDLDRNVRIFNEMYPRIRIDLVLVHAPFNPTTFAYVSHKLNIPRNLMFISTPNKGFRWRVSDLGGCRVIAR